MSTYIPLKPHFLEDHTPDEGYIFFLHTLETHSGHQMRDKYYFFRILEDKKIEFLVANQYDNEDQTETYTYQEELSRPLRKVTMVNSLKSIISPNWLESGAKMYHIESPLLTEQEFIQILDDITTDYVLNGYVSDKKWQDSSLVKYCKAIGWTLSPTIDSEQIMSCKCPVGLDHNIYIDAYNEKWSCSFCGEQGHVKELESFIEKCKNGYKPHHVWCKTPSFDMGTSCNIQVNLQTAIVLAQKSAMLKEWKILVKAGAIVQEMCNAKVVHKSLQEEIKNKRTKNRLLRQLKMYEKSIPVVKNYMDETINSLKQLESDGKTNPVEELLASGANLALILAKISNRCHELQDEVKAGDLIKAWGRSGLFMEVSIHRQFGIKPKIKSEHRQMICNQIDFLFEVTEHSVYQSDHILRIELVKGVDWFHDILIQNKVNSYRRLNEYRLNNKLQDTSREYWFMGKIFMAIRSRHPKARFYTTHEIQERYGIEGRTTMIPRTEKIDPGWAGLSKLPYANPSSQDWDNYLVIYELSLDHEFNLPVMDYEPENHPFIVFRDNTEKIEIKEFKYTDSKLVLLHDYW